MGKGIHLQDQADKKMTASCSAWPWR